MKKEQGLDMLKAIPESDIAWRVNKGLTISQAKEIKSKRISK